MFPFSIVFSLVLCLIVVSYLHNAYEVRKDAEAWKVFVFYGAIGSACADFTKLALGVVKWYIS